MSNIILHPTEDVLFISCSGRLVFVFCDAFGVLSKARIIEETCIQMDRIFQSQDGRIFGLAKRGDEETKVALC